MEITMEDNTNELWLGTMHTVIEQIGPDKAREYLERNNCNRPYKIRTAEQYARDMIAGKWRLKPIPLCFDENGDLINGQHTFHAMGSIPDAVSRCARDLEK